MYAFANGVSLLCHRGSGRISVGGVLRDGPKIAWGSRFQALDEQEWSR